MALADDLVKLTQSVTALQAKVERLEAEKATLVELENLRKDAKGSHDDQSQAIKAIEEALPFLTRDASEAKGLSERNADTLASHDAAMTEIRSEIVELSSRPTGGGGLYDEWMLPKEGFPFGLYRELIPGSQYNIVIRYLSAPPIVEPKSDAE